MSNHHPESKTRRRTITPVIAAIAALLALVAACSADDNDSSAVTATSSDSADEAMAAPVEHAAESDSGFATGDGDDRGDAAFEDSAAQGEPSAFSTGSAGSEANAQLPDLGRDIIFTARLEIASTDVSAGTREAIRAVEARGGFLFSQETQGGPGGSSIMTFKVLPDQFQAALNDLGSVGEVRSQSISAEDVSAVVVDLESRINTAEASVIRLRDLLDDAAELETIATLENQLLQRETTLEQLRGQLRTVRSQVDLATITVVVSELTNRPGLAIETMTYAGHDAGFGCFETGRVRSVEQDDAVTICYRLTNTGDTPLVDLTFDDPALGATLGSLVVVDGTTTQLEPGTSVLLAQETELEESIRLRTSVTATALDADGNPLEDEVKATAATVRLDVVTDDDDLPSFGEVLSDSWNALVTVAVVIALVAVAVAPFLVVALALGIPVWLLVRRRRAARPTAQQGNTAQQGSSAQQGVGEEHRPPPPPAAATDETDGPADADSAEKAATTS